MTMPKTLRLVLLAGLIGAGLATVERAIRPGSGTLIATAQAVVGRPLTPVSVAGVARRTARRCAVGVYTC
jgi:hypothetical protein